MRCRSSNVSPPPQIQVSWASSNLFPYEFQAEILAEQLRKHNLENVLFNLPLGNWATGGAVFAQHDGW
jgi:hydroxypyruvate isomerase